MDEKLRQAYLYDFYGELLNGHQRQVYEDFVFNDFSLSEIAEERSISRQGVSDLIRRCNRKLEDYEAKLHLVERFLSVRGDVARIRALSADFLDTGDRALIGQIVALSDRICEEL
ncbi:MAG: DNA-binding protein [Muribaculaceae bacterium]|nr:DNA-binding protein [Roseburia sp.]MCM1431150.1 DNA-binding protein [Muribaculaceae bacterium]MCM1492573.1 DNA-binding protein [Muribaculaceae bacterium]